MRELEEFFKGLFSTTEWPARWNCGYWSDFHGWVYIVSELLIWAAYFLIPLIILNYLSRKKTALKFNKAYLYFAAFILLCGSTHFLDALMFWVPMYRLNALLRLATAVVSLATVYHLIKILPEAFKQKTNVELENEIFKRKQIEHQLEEANKGLAAFAYVASHDLQEPLRKITIFTSKLLQTNKNNLDDEGKELANKVLDSSERMRNLIQDVLTLSSIVETGDLSKVDTEKAVQTAIENLELPIKEKNAVVRCGKLPRVFGNEAYLSQLFFNLIGNALKFSEGPPVVDISGEVKEGRAFLHVSDNGIGMKEQDLNKIFDAFHRLNSKTKFEGTGIGLSICKRIVELHNGTINVTSTVGKGSVFTIELQAADA